MSLLLASACALSGPSLQPARAQEDGLERAFKSPPKEARPWVRWWWPGGAVQDSELRREVDALDEAGFGGGEIQPFNPGVPDLTPAERAAINDYATPSFFAHVGAALDEAKARSLRLDYTFGSAWPAGGGHVITPELALLELGVSSTTVQSGSGGVIHLSPPPRTHKLGAWSSLDERTREPKVADWPARMDARQKIVAVIAVKGSAPSLRAPIASGFKLDPWRQVIAPGQLQSGTAIVLTNRLRADGVLDWTPPAGDWQVLVFKQYVADSSVSAGVGQGPQLVLDHFKRTAFEAHADRVGDAAVPQLGPYFGGALRASFVDSLELMPDLYWSEDLLAEFKRRRGYDLTPFMPLLIQPGWVEAWTAHWSQPYYLMPGQAQIGEIGARVREDYRRTLSELIIENFYGPFVAWNHAHGLLARLQAHGAPSDTLKTYGLSDIPETEDLESRADIDFMKLARSAGDIYGRREISAESWCWPGRPYAVTPEELKRRADLIFASGVNRLVIHGFPYALHTDHWPGWHPFAPGFGLGFSTMLSETNPIWAVTPALTAYLARAQSVLQAGANVVPVAMFMEDAAFYQGHETQGHRELSLLGRLVRAGYDYDRINTDGLVASHIEGGQLVTPGGHRFSVIVLPRSLVLDLAAAEALARFARQGLRTVFVDAPPERSEGLHDAMRRDGQLRSAVAAILAHGGSTLAEAQVPEGLKMVGVPANLQFDPGGEASFVEKAVADKRIYFLRNDTGAEQSVGFTAPEVAGGAQIWDAWTGEVKFLPTEPTADGRHVRFTLKPGASAFAVFGPNIPATGAPNKAGPTVLATQPLAEGWTLSADGHGAGGRKITGSRPIGVLSDLREVAGLTDFAGVAHYVHAFEAPADWLASGRRVRLNLGQVNDAAIITVNGERLTTLVMRPFEADITSALRPGENLIEVEVVNAPENAMAASGGPAARDLRSQPAGLIGPVSVESLGQPR